MEAKACIVDFSEGFMEQGRLSSSCYSSLTQEEISSLSKIRNHYNKKPIFSFSIEEALVLVDSAFESMGRPFRTRVNEGVKEFGRYSGELDGVFLLISDALRAYDQSTLFYSTPAEAEMLYAQHKKEVRRARKKLDNSFGDITFIVNCMLPSVWAIYNVEKLHSALDLNEIRSTLGEKIALMDFEGRPESRAESFVNGVCMCLVWHADIRPTKPMSDSLEKSPLLRFLEVFYPVEAKAILSRIYDRERGLPTDEKIGAKFISPR